MDATQILPREDMMPLGDRVETPPNAGYGSKVKKEAKDWQPNDVYLCPRAKGK